MVYISIAEDFINKYSIKKINVLVTLLIIKKSY